VQAELTVQGDSVPTRLETSDVSAGGRYLQMAFTLDIGTPLNIILWLGHKKLSLEGRVVTRHPQFGNGIEFTGLSPASQERMQQFLEHASVTQNRSDGSSVARII
jgi:PilZ domain